MPTSDDLLLFDTSAALGFADTDNPAHRQLTSLAGKRRRGLSGHAAFEFMSVLTRLPLPKRVHSADARRLIRDQFPECRFLPPEVADSLIDQFPELGIAGGMVYDALVGACAKHHDLTLITCDRRAEETYRLLGTRYHLVQPAVTPAG